MAWGLIVGFWGVSALFVITPGADWAYAISAGLRHRSPVPAVVGMLAGHLLATLVVAAGVGALVASVPAVLTTLTVVGALYLAWLGIGLLRRPASVPTADVASVSGSPLTHAVKGIGISGLNPKVFLLFLALLPQFTDVRGPWPVGVQMVLLGCLHVLSCAVVYFAVAFGARRVLATRPAAARIVTRVSGAVMILIGVILVAEKVHTSVWS